MITLRWRLGKHIARTEDKDATGSGSVPMASLGISSDESLSLSPETKLLYKI
jgi:hypothetical protein